MSNKNKRSWEVGAIDNSDVDVNIGKPQKDSTNPDKPKSVAKKTGSWRISKDVYLDMKITRMRAGYDTDSDFIEDAIREKIKRETP